MFAPSAINSNLPEVGCSARTSPAANRAHASGSPSWKGSLMLKVVNAVFEADRNFEFPERIRGGLLKSSERRFPFGLKSILLIEMRGGLSRIGFTIAPQDTLTNLRRNWELLYPYPIVRAATTRLMTNAQTVYNRIKDTFPERLVLKNVFRFSIAEFQDILPTLDVRASCVSMVDIENNMYTCPIQCWTLREGNRYDNRRDLTGCRRLVKTLESIKDLLAVDPWEDLEDRCRRILDDMNKPRRQSALRQIISAFRKNDVSPEALVERFGATEIALTLKSMLAQQASAA